MVVAVDIRLAEEDYRNFIYQTFSRIVKEYPQHNFVFISDKPDESFIEAKNSSVQVVTSPKIPLLTKLLADKNISAALKKNKVDVLISTQTLSQNKLPQILIFNKNCAITFLKKANKIIAFSEFFKKIIIEKFKISEDKIYIVAPGVDDMFQPINFEEREKTKEEYAEGKEYFFCIEETGSANNLLNLLKAFSLFKKRQKSSMQLLIAAKLKLSDNFLQQLNLYKFKNDVKILREFPLTEIMASSYAFINFPKSEGFSSSPLQAIKLDVPVITVNDEMQPEICGDAALFINADDHIDIADKLMLIFKDEKLRTELISRGKKHIKKYSWNSAAQQLWQCVEEAIVI